MKDADTAPVAGPAGPVFLGERLRREREAQDYSVRALARRLDVSPSLISAVERGKTTPSVGTLYAIVRELGISFDGIFAPEPDDPATQEDEGPVVHDEDRRTIYLASGVRWERLTAEKEPDLDFQIATYEPGSESCPPDQLVTHGGREFGFVISGQLDVTIEDRTFHLGTEDSISFSSTRPHRLANPGRSPARTLWAIAGRERDDRIADAEEDRGGAKP